MKPNAKDHGPLRRRLHFRNIELDVRVHLEEFVVSAVDLILDVFFKICHLIKISRVLRSCKDWNNLPFSPSAQFELAFAPYLDPFLPSLPSAYDE